MEKVRLDASQEIAVREFLREPFNTFNDHVNVHPAIGEGYPGITVYQHDRNADGVADEWTVGFSVDTRDGRRKKLDPRNGYLVDDTVLRVEQDPNGTGPLLVYKPWTRCSDYQSAVCIQLAPTIREWARQRPTLNADGMESFIEAFVRPHHGRIAIANVVSENNFLKMKNEALERERTHLEEESLGYLQLAIAGFAAAGSATIALALNLARRFFEEQDNTEEIRARFRVQREARMRAPGTDLPRTPFVDEQGRSVDNMELGELFLKAQKEKLVGSIEILPIDDTYRVRFTDQRSGRIVYFRAEEVLSMRDREEDLTGDFSRLEKPQFRDKSVNISGTRGDRTMVVVDFRDPRLVRFLEEKMQPIRDRFQRVQITEREAAEEAWRVVRDYVPYDRAQALPNEMFSLGDFIEKGVCNERGMLLQVSLQYIGIESRMEKGPFVGGRHAWVRAFVHDGPEMRHRPVEVILDPQQGRMYDVDEEGVTLYRDDSTPFARDAAQTVFMAKTDPSGRPVVSEERIINYLEERWPSLRNTHNRGFVHRVAQETLRSWEQEGRPTIARIDPPLPVERIIEECLDRLLREHDRDNLLRPTLREEDRGRWSHQRRRPGATDAFRRALERGREILGRGRR